MTTSTSFCQYQKICPYSVINCDANEWRFCKQYSKYKHDELDLEQDRKEQARVHELNDIGLVGRLG